MSPLLEEWPTFFENLIENCSTRFDLPVHRTRQTDEGSKKISLGRNFSFYHFPPGTRSFVVLIDVSNCVHR